MSAIDQREFQAAIKALREISKEAGNSRVRKRIYRKAAKPILEKAKSLVPVKSGKLRDTLTIKTFRKSQDVFVGLKGNKRKEGFPFYAAMVEFGTRYAEPRPYMRPALDATRAEAKQIIIDETRKQIDRIAKKKAKGVKQ